MKFLGITFFTVACFATPLRNSNPTIWAEKTVTVMKAQIDRMYSFNQGLYNKRHVFDFGGTACIVPPPPPHYFVNNTCANGNKLAADAILSIETAWKSLAAAMFPVTYNMPDTAGQPRASFSDFSHFYNHFNIEIQSLQNTSSYYLCKANIRPNSDYWNAIYTSYINSQDYVTVRFGPVVGYFDGTIPEFANNGTEQAYPYEGPFEDSIRTNIGLTMDGFEDLLLEMSNSPAEFPTGICKSFKTNGLKPPRPPSTFP